MENKHTDYLQNRICPLCHCKVTTSEYLNNIFKEDPQANYLSHLVTNYRHIHITSWDKCWGYNGTRYRNVWFVEYDEEKKKVNEQAKRQIIRKGGNIQEKIGISSDVFKRLQNTKEATMKLAILKLE